jgi:hypothetical protein
VAKRLRGRNGVEVVLKHRELERMAQESAGAEKPRLDRVDPHRAES